MRIISRKKLKEAAERHSDLNDPLEDWYKIAKQATWQSLDDVRRIWRNTDAVGQVYGI